MRTTKGPPSRRAFCLFKIEEIFEFLIQRNAEDQGQLGGGTELAGLDGTDGVPGDAHHLRKLSLGKSGAGAGFLYMIP